MTPANDRNKGTPIASEENLTLFVFLLTFSAPIDLQEICVGVRARSQLKKISRPFFAPLRLPVFIISRGHPLEITQWRFFPLLLSDINFESDTTGGVGDR